MRPAVTANFLRRVAPESRDEYTGPTGRNRRVGQHAFSSKRLLIMVLCGVLLFVPGLGLSVASLDHSEEDYTGMTEGQRIMFQVVGPSMCAAGAIVMFASCIYYYCYGSGEAATPPSNSNHQSDHDEEKGSIRSSKREQHHHHHHHHHHHNGRTSDIHSPDSECRVSLRGTDDSRSASKTPNRTPTNDEEVPLAKIEDSSELAPGQSRAAPAILIHVPDHPGTFRGLDEADVFQYRHLDGQGIVDEDDFDNQDEGEDEDDYSDDEILDVDTTSNQERHLAGGGYAKVNQSSVEARVPSNSKDGHATT